MHSLGLRLQVLLACHWCLDLPSMTRPILSSITSTNNHPRIKLAQIEFSAWELMWVNVMLVRIGRVMLKNGLVYWELVEITLVLVNYMNKISIHGNKPVKGHFKVFCWMCWYVPYWRGGGCIVQISNSMF